MAVIPKNTFCTLCFDSSATLDKGPQTKKAPAGTKLYTNQCGSRWKFTSTTLAMVVHKLDDHLIEGVFDILKQFKFHGLPDQTLTPAMKASIATQESKHVPISYQRGASDDFDPLVLFAVCGMPYYKIFYDFVRSQTWLIHFYYPIHGVELTYLPGPFVREGVTPDIITLDNNDCFPLNFHECRPLVFRHINKLILPELEMSSDPMYDHHEIQFDDDFNQILEHCAKFEKLACNPNQMEVVIRHFPEKLANLKTLVIDAHNFQYNQTFLQTYPFPLPNLEKLVIKHYSFNDIFHSEFTTNIRYPKVTKLVLISPLLDLLQIRPSNVRSFVKLFPQLDDKEVSEYILDILRAFNTEVDDTDNLRSIVIRKVQQKFKMTNKICGPVYSKKDYRPRNLVWELTS